MTAVKHPFESFDAHKFRRFKTEKILDAYKHGTLRFCQATVNPRQFPKPVLPQDPRPYVVPAHSRWFSFKKIHRIERAEFPEISDPDEAKIYKRIRNKSVKLFRLYPTHEVTPTTIRHFEGGDFTKILKIHQFLCLWGLINFMPCFAPSQSYPIDLRLVQDYSKIFSDSNHPLSTNSNQLNSHQHIDIQCSICKATCGEGHYCSKKYPGVVICTQCFSHQNILTHLEIPHSAFEFRTLPSNLNVEINLLRNQQRPITQQPQKPQDDEFKILQNVSAAEDKVKEKIKEDWVQISEKTDSKSPLDCLILFLRNSLGDISRNLRLTNHEFGDVNPIIELLEFVRQDEDDQAGEIMSEETQEKLPPLNYNDNWEEIEEEILKEEEDIRNDLSFL